MGVREGGGRGEEGSCGTVGYALLVTGCMDVFDWRF